MPGCCRGDISSANVSTLGASNDRCADVDTAKSLISVTGSFVLLQGSKSLRLVVVLNTGSSSSSEQLQSTLGSVPVLQVQELLTELTDPLSLSV